MKVYVVSRVVGGYAREDSATSSPVAVLTDPERARIVKACSGFGATMEEVEVDVIPAGIQGYAAELGYKL